MTTPDALDLACSLLDDARHAAAGGRTKLAAALNPILFGESASRLVREWEQRKKSARDITPAHVLIHQHNQQRGTT